MKKTTIILTSLVLLLNASTVFAQSTVSGTITTGSSSGLSGTVTPSSSSTITGTVVSTTTTGGGGGGGGGGGSGTNTIDICSNIAGTQSTLPSGYVLSGGNCIVDPNAGSTGGTGGSTSGGVLGTDTSTPNVPNTGEGGTASGVLALLLAAGAAAALGTRSLLKYRAS